MKKVLIVYPPEKEEEGIKSGPKFFQETDFTDKEGNKLLNKSGLVIIKKIRK